MSSAPIAAKPTSDTTLELDALASIYRRAIERYQEENAADAVTSSIDGDDTKEGSRDDFRATDIIRNLDA